MAFKQKRWSPFTKKEDYIPQSQKGKYYKMKMDAKTKKIKLKKSKIQPGDYEPQTVKPRYFKNFMYKLTGNNKYLKK
tara:strand:+ start:1595 stop:1825 length:231 start_codon:yes stop_codon:yes gene_type:complete